MSGDSSGRRPEGRGRAREPHRGRPRSRSRSRSPLGSRRGAAPARREAPERPSLDDGEPSDSGDELLDPASLEAETDHGLCRQIRHQYRALINSVQRKAGRGTGVGAGARGAGGAAARRRLGRLPKGPPHPSCPSGRTTLRGRLPKGLPKGPPHPSGPSGRTTLRGRVPGGTAPRRPSPPAGRRGRGVSPGELSPARVPCAACGPRAPGLAEFEDRPVRLPRGCERQAAGGVEGAAPLSPRRLGRSPLRGAFLVQTRPARRRGAGRARLARCGGWPAHCPVCVFLKQKTGRTS